MYEYRAYVSRVYDGDTITVDIDLGFGIVFKSQKIRLVRINAPEIRGDERQTGLVSRDALRDKIEEAAEAKLKEMAEQMADDFSVDDIVDDLI